MDHFRRASAAVDNDKDEDPRSSAFSPPAIIRDSSSAFSKPILPASSSLLSPRPLFAGGGGANGGTTSFAIGSVPSVPDPLPPASSPARYRECLRNHAASLGGHVIDGCGEFMPVGPTDPLKCAACGCHRSFHRREPEPEPDIKFGSSSSYRVPLLLPPAPHPNPLRFSGNTTDQSSSEERNTNPNTNTNPNNGKNPEHRRDSGRESRPESARKKRFRSKFSTEQKERMKEFADGIGWRVQKKDEGQMERFCIEVGVSRRVLKVWMHNNKHLIKKQQVDDDNVRLEGGHHHHHHHDVA